MIVAIHQPNYIPWIGYFYKMLKADTFVFLDNVQFSRGSFQNRNRIKTANGLLLLTQPVPHSRGDYPVTNEVEFANPRWPEDHVKVMSQSYRRARGYDYFFERLQEAYLTNQSQKLADFNIGLTQQIASWLGLNTRTVRASELEVEGKSTRSLASICRALGATAYLSGTGGQNYLDEDVFNVSGIELMYSDFAHPRYPQLWGEFTPNLSIIDLLLNCGEDSAEVLASCGSEG